ncbi:MAG: hypothetical protein HQK64_14200, partial [Desulfamplus sp.]|nr:hypothetical protein [Desulfamplus sp.]
MRDILISTAGTSLLGNIKNSILNSSNDKYHHIKKYFVSNESKSMAQGLCQLNDTDRVCGAEINSVAFILSQGLLNERFYHFILISDTQDGEIVGNTLLNYYSQPFNKNSRFQNVKVHKVEGLNSDNAKR